MNLLKTLNELTDSKKATILTASIAAIVSLATAGLAPVVTAMAIGGIAMVSAAYLLAQGLADQGKEAGKVDAPPEGK